MSPVAATHCPAYPLPMTAQDPIAALQRRIDTLWAQTGHPAGSRIATQPDGMATPFVIWDGTTYTIAIDERGQEIARYAPLSQDQATDWFLTGMATAQAQKDELTTRQGQGYSRWNWMYPAVDLLQSIAPHAAAALRDHDTGFLTRHPLTAEERRFARHPLP
jgi:hypothetical protein